MQLHYEEIIAEVVLPKLEQTDRKDFRIALGVALDIEEALREAGYVIIHEESQGHW